MQDRIRAINELFRQTVLEIESECPIEQSRAEEIYLQANDINYEPGMCMAMLIYGVTSYQKGDYREAYNYYQRCSQLCESYNDAFYRGYYQVNLGDYYLKVNAYSDALNAYVEALEHLSSINDPYNLKLRITASIGHIYIELEAFGKAYGYFCEMIVLSQEAGTTKYLSNTYSVLATCMLMDGHFVEAKDYLDKSLTYAINKEKPFELAFVYLNYGTYHRQLKAFEKAIEYYNKAMVIYKTHQSEQGQAKILSELGQLYFDRGDLVEAERLLQRCNLLILGKNNKTVELKVDGLLGQIYEVQNDYEKALTYYKHFYSLKEENDRNWKRIKVDNTINFFEDREKDAKVKALEYDHSLFQSLSILGREIASVMDKEEIISKVSANIRKVIEADYFVVALKDDRYIDFLVQNGDSASQNTIKADNPLSVIANMANTSKTVVLRDIKSGNPLAGRMVLSREKLKDINMLMSCPLIYDDQVIGSLIVGRRGSIPFMNKEQEVLELLSAYTTIAYHNWLQSKQLIEANKELKHLTEYDALTKVYNRYALGNKTDQLMLSFSGSKDPLNILMIDIDFFKEYNDYYGHLEGDECLIKVAELLVKEVREYQAQIYRYGGDEFLITLEGVSEDEGFRIADQARSAVEALAIEHKYSNCSDYVTLTVGVGSLYEMANVNEGFTIADRALYRAKNKGRNNVQQIIQ